MLCGMLPLGGRELVVIGGPWNREGSSQRRNANQEADEEGEK